jgi:hypothetical protein
MRFSEANGHLFPETISTVEQPYRNAWHGFFGSRLAAPLRAISAKRHAAAGVKTTHL